MVLKQLVVLVEVVQEVVLTMKEILEQPTLVVVVEVATNISLTWVVMVALEL